MPKDHSPPEPDASPTDHSSLADSSRRAFLRRTGVTAAAASGLTGGLSGIAAAEHPLQQVPLDVQVTERAPDSLSLSWDEPDAVSPPYRVTLRWGDYAWSTTTEASSLTLDRPPIAPNTSYEIDVEEVDEGGTAMELGNGSVAVDTPPTPPEERYAPDVPTVTERTNTGVSLTWGLTGRAGSDDAPIDHFAIAYAEVSDGGVVGEFAQTTTPTTGTTLSPLAVGRRYLIQVWTVTASGAESRTRSTTIRTAGDATAPSAPANLRQTDRTASTASLAWDPATDEGGSGLDRYALEWGQWNHERDEVRGIASATISGDATETTIDGLEPDNEYAVALHAVDGAGHRSDPVRTTVSTADGDPAVTDYDVDSLEKTTSDPNHGAEIYPWSEADRVTIVGSYVHSDSCGETSLYDLSYDGETLTVDMRGVRPDEQMACLEALHEETYRLDVSLTSAPSEVVVNHGTGEQAWQTTWTPSDSQTRHPLTVDLAAEEITAGEQTEAALTLRDAPPLVESFELTLSLSNTDAVEIAHVALEDGFERTGGRPTAEPGDEVTIAGSASDRDANPAPEPQRLATVTLDGTAAGESVVDVTAESLIAADDTAIDAVGLPASLSVTGADDGVTNVDFRRLSARSSSTEDSAQIVPWSSEDRVSVAGSITLPDSCHAPVVASTEFDGETLTVRMGTEDTSDPDVVCLPSLYQGEYRLDVSLASAPSEVVVVHGSGEDAWETRWQASDSPTPKPVEFRLDRETLGVGGTADGEVVVMDHPVKIYSFEFTVSVGDPGVATIADVSVGGQYPSVTVTRSDDGSSVRVDASAEGAIGVLPTPEKGIATVTLEGESAGATDVDVSVERITKSSGEEIPAVGLPTTVVAERLTPTPSPEPVPGDLDGDGLSEDVNGNGEADFGDVTALFDQMDGIEDPSRFDFNGNGELDFGDVVALFEDV